MLRLSSMSLWSRTSAIQSTMPSDDEEHQAHHIHLDVSAYQISHSMLHLPPVDAPLFGTLRFSNSLPNIPVSSASLLDAYCWTPNCSTLRLPPYHPRRSPSDVTFTNIVTLGMLSFFMLLIGTSLHHAGPFYLSLFTFFLQRFKP